MDNITEDFIKAFHYHKNGQLAEAELLYSQILQQDKNNLGALINLGVIYKLKGDWDEAIRLYKKAIFIQPDELAANYQLAEALRKSGHLDEAVKYYNKALAVKPFDANLLTQLGSTLLKLEKLDEALFFFKHALNITPDSITLNLKIGNILMWKGQFEEALRYFQQALIISPSYVDARGSAGIVLVRQNKLQEALSEFAQVLSVNPHDRKIQKWFSLVQILLAGKNEVTFTYEGIPISFCITGKNLGVELEHIDGKFYEIEELQVISRHIGDRSIIVDVGCNAGNHLVYFAKVLKAAKVIPVEFHPQIIEILNKNIKLNALTNIDLSKLGYAVGKSRSRASLREHPANDFCLTEVYESQEGEINIVSLDELIVEKVDLLKIDVQGLELDVLEGAQQLIREYKPDIFIEVTKRNESDFFKLLNRIGYRAIHSFDRWSYRNFYVKPIATGDNPIQISPNSLY